MKFLSYALSFLVALGGFGSSLIAMNTALSPQGETLKKEFTDVDASFNDPCWNPVWEHGLKSPQAEALFLEKADTFPSLNRVNRIILHKHGKRLVDSCHGICEKKFITINANLKNRIDNEPLFQNEQYKVNQFYHLWNLVYPKKAPKTCDPDYVLAHDISEKDAETFCSLLEKETYFKDEGTLIINLLKKWGKVKSNDSSLSAVPTQSSSAATPLSSNKPKFDDLKQAFLALELDRNSKIDFNDQCWKPVWENGLDHPAAQKAFIDKIAESSMSDIYQVNGVLHQNGKHLQPFGSLFITIDSNLYSAVQKESSLMPVSMFSIPGDNIQEFIRLWGKVYVDFAQALKASGKAVKDCEPWFIDDIIQKNPDFDATDEFYAFISASSDKDAKKLTELLQKWGKVKAAPVKAMANPIVNPLSTGSTIGANPDSTTKATGVTNPSSSKTSSTTLVDDVQETPFGRKLKNDLQKACLRIFSDKKFNSILKIKDAEGLNEYSENFDSVIVAKENEQNDPVAISDEEIEGINKVFDQYGLRYIRIKSVVSEGYYAFKIVGKNHFQVKQHIPFKQPAAMPPVVPSPATTGLSNQEKDASPTGAHNKFPYEALKQEFLALKLAQNSKINFNDPIWDPVWQYGLNSMGAHTVFNKKRNDFDCIDNEFDKINSILHKHRVHLDFSGFITINQQIYNLITQEESLQENDKVQEFINMWIYGSTTIIAGLRNGHYRTMLMKGFIAVEDEIEFCKELDTNNRHTKKLIDILIKWKEVPQNILTLITSPVVRQDPPVDSPDNSDSDDDSQETDFGQQLKAELIDACPRIFRNSYWNNLWVQNAFDVNNSEIVETFMKYDSGNLHLQPKDNKEVEAINTVLTKHGAQWIRTKSAFEEDAYKFTLAVNARAAKHIPFSSTTSTPDTTEPDSDSPDQPNNTGMSFGKKLSLIGGGVVLAAAATTGAVIAGKKLHALIRIDALDAQSAVLKTLLDHAEQSNQAIAAAYKKAKDQLPCVSKKTHAQMQALIDAQQYGALSKLIKAEYERLVALRKNNWFKRIFAGLKHMITN